MKKLPPQTKKVMKIRQEFAFMNVCWICQSEDDFYHIWTQGLQIAG